MREPDKAGVARAWRIRPTEANEAAHTADWGYAPSGVGADWIVNGPYHPFWSWWYIACVHLRPVEGAPPAHVRFPGATHEVMCLSLNPDPKDGRPRVPDVEKVEAGDVLGGLPGFLEPADWVVQVILPSDEKAAELVELVIDHIVAGRSCDSDYRSWWETSIQQTAEHLRLGGHPDEAT